MKRLIILFGIVLLFGMMTTPSFARGWRGMEFGPMRGQGPGLGMDHFRGGFPIRPEFIPLTEDQRTQLGELKKKFQEDTAEFREALFDKSKELNTILTSEEPDEKKAKALQKEINDLRAKLSEKQLNLRLEITRVIPESDFGRGFNRFFGMDSRMGGFPHRPGHSPLTEEQRDRLNGLNKDFQEETAELREELSNKSGELRKILTSEKPDAKKAKALQKEISELRAELSQKTLDLRLEVREILPETGYARGYGRGFGPFKGFRPRMGRGRGMGRAPGF
jgi:Spy/CpxP family protein refolding chaperone